MGMPGRRESLRPNARLGTVAAEIPFGIALRRTLAIGYDTTALRADVLAGAVVGIVALPLSMALAIAVGVPPQHGLYTAIVARRDRRARAAAPSSRSPVRRPPSSSSSRRSSRSTACRACSPPDCWPACCWSRWASPASVSFIQFIPYPVTTGFTAGIATVIATLQLKDVLGLDGRRTCRTTFADKVAALWPARGTLSLAELASAPRRSRSCSACRA